jgi:hypothetical protein
MLRVDIERHRKGPTLKALAGILHTNGVKCTLSVVREVKIKFWISANVAPSDAGDSAPFLSVTPLYNFSSDVTELFIDTGIRVCRFDDCLTIPFDEAIAKHLQVHEPDYLLWHDPLLSGDIFTEDFLQSYAALKGGNQEKRWEFLELFIASTRKLFGLMRLFKPGRLRGGETFVLFRNSGDDNRRWNTLGTGRASMMVVDYTALAAQETSYVLLSTEIPFLQAFRESLVPLLRQMTSFPTVETALHLYGADNGERLDVVGAVTALEALLTKKEETEGLTYRLSMRIANLLGHDHDARKAIFLNVRNFYNLRSRIVHGVELDTKLLNRLNELDSLRETVRRVLLSVMALLSEGIHPIDLPDLLDDLALGDEKRKQVQAKASRFLHISSEKASS